MRRGNGEIQKNGELEAIFDDTGGLYIPLLITHYSG